jgi:hypothetical protein
VKLPDDLDARLRHESKRRGPRVSNLTRDAIGQYLGGSDDHAKLHLLAAGSGRSGHQATSERIEEILSKEVGGSLS